MKYHDSNPNELAQAPLHARHTLEHAAGAVTALAYSYCGATLAACGGTAVELYQNGVRVARLAADTALRDVAFAPDGSALVTGGDAAVDVWDVATRARRAHQPGAGAHSVAVSPEGSVFASGSDDKIVHVWNLAAARLVKTLGDHRDSRTVHALQFDKTGARLAAGDDTVVLWDVEAGRRLATFGSGVSALRYSCDSRAVVTGATDGAVSAWDVRIPDPPATRFAVHRGRVCGVAYAPCSRWVLSVAHDGKVVFTDLRMGVATLQLDVAAEPLVSVVHNPFSRDFAAAARNGRVGVWSYGAR